MKNTTIDRVMEKKYASHCRALTKKDQNAVHPSFVEFLKEFTAKMADDKVEISQEMTDAVEALGWKIVDYTPQSGGNKNISNKYLKNDEARVNGGFILVTKSALQLLRDRFVANIDAIDAVLTNL